MTGRSAVGLPLWLVLATGFGPPGFGQPAAPAARLLFADKVRLVNCDPASVAPAFRLKLNMVDANGLPLAAALPEPDKLAQSMSVTLPGHDLTPFYAVAANGTGGQVRRRIALVLIDVSGSMNQTLPSGQSRFSAAVAAAQGFVRAFEEGVDQVAIVPFASRNVVSTINAARFARTGAEVRQQIANLPAPEPRGNTALFSAVDAGLGVLANYSRNTPGSPEVLLIALTDGKNDVGPNDDFGLLDGLSGQQAVAEKVRSAGIQVVGVGFGNPQAIDAAALKQISTQSYMVQGAAELSQVFAISRTLLNDRLHVTFASPWTDRASLAGQTLPVTVSLKLADGRVLQSNTAAWAAPQIGVPVYDSACDAGEMKAVLRSVELSGADGWMVVLRPALVFLGLGTLLLVAWFWLPRLIWPDQYVGSLAVLRERRRWATERPTRPADDRDQRGDAGPRQPAPPGFGQARGGSPVRERTPGDATVVQPRADLGTRTRLDLDWDDERRR